MEESTGHEAVGLAVSDQGTDQAKVVDQIGAGGAEAAGSCCHLGQEDGHIDRDKSHRRGVSTNCRSGSGAGPYPGLLV